MNTRVLHTKLTGEGAKRSTLAGGVCGPDMPDVILGQLGMRVVDPVSGIPAIGSVHVGGVLRVVPKVEMIGVDAQAIVTPMENQKAAGDFAVSHDPRSLVSIGDFAIEAKGVGPDVISDLLGKLPDPTPVVSNIKLFLETLLKRFTTVITTHALILCRNMGLSKPTFRQVQGEIL